MKIDHRKHYGIMIDTETANGIMNGDKLDLSCSLPYDIGFAVIDSNGNIYETHSYVVSDIFYGMVDVMKTAYYADKIPHYLMDISCGKRIVKSAYAIRMILLDKIKEYDCEFVVAHNMRFDLNACNNLQRWTTKSKYRYFFPRGIEFWDTLKMARSVLRDMPTYRKFCEENGYLTKHKTPQPQYTAEVVYRFITKDTDFMESHTGLEDVLIEVEILKYCKKQHKKMDKKLF